MRISKLTTKYQTTIPSEIRKKLDLHSGDKVGFEIKNDRVYLVKIAPFDADYHQALESTLSEWGSEEDDEAYNDL